LEETTETWVERLTKAGVPSGPIYTIDQVFADPQVKHLGMAVPLEKPGRGPVEYVGQPMKLSRTPSRIYAHPPGQGEHTDEILAELGYSDAEIRSFRERQIV
jgi:formyl-CoA transferase